MSFRLLGCGMLLFVAGLAPAQADEEPKMPVIKLTVSAASPKTTPLRYQLLPDELDQVRGNAAPFWMRAGHAAGHVPMKWTEKTDSWLNVPLKDLPRKDVRAFLDAYKTAFRLTDQAARHTQCDWGMPPFTVQEIDLPLDEVQKCRQLAQLLALRCRLELAEGDLDAAFRTLQTGFALGGHVAEGPTIIQGLVGVAVSAVMLARLEEVMQSPAVPNLYWALTALPSPLVDMRPAVRMEMGTIFRSFPQLRDLEKATLTANQVEKLVGELTTLITQWSGEGKGAELAMRLGFGVMAASVYPEAKEYLIGQGLTKEKVEAMPALQAAVVYMLKDYRASREKVIALMGLPYWQSVEALDRVGKDLNKPPSNVINILVRLLMPAVNKAYAAGARMDRYIAALRCVEAIRLQAAADDGKLPAKLSDVKVVPLPVDPFTGKGFDDCYKKEDGKAVFVLPPPPGQPPIVGRRYELTPAR